MGLINAIIKKRNPIHYNIDFKFPNQALDILKLVYCQNAILLNDSEALFPNFINKALNSKYVKWSHVGDSPVPILGLFYKIPNNLQLLKFKYSEYPFLNKTIISNCMIQEQVKFTLEAYNFITQDFGILEIFGYNIALIKTLESYISNGGTFTIITPWGFINDCLCEGVSGTLLDDKDPGGQSLVFNFTTSKIAKKNTLSQIAQALGG